MCQCAESVKNLIAKFESLENIIPRVSESVTNLFLQFWSFVMNISKVKIIGLKGDVLDNTHQVLLQDAKRMQDNMTSRRIREFIKRAPGNIKKSTAPFGYFKPKTTSRVTHQEKLWLINFTVSPGKVVKVKKFKITITGDGKNTEPFNKYIILQHKKIQIKRKKCQNNIKEAATVVPSDLHIQVSKFERGLL